MKKVIIAIHGLGNKPDETLLRESWLQAIHEGLTRAGKQRSDIPFEMVYWADISYPAPLSADIKNPDDPLFLEEPYSVSPSSASPPKGRRLYMSVLEFIEDHLDRLFLKKNLDETFPAASTKMMESFFSELDTYYTQESSSKIAIQKRLIEKLRAYAGYEILLLSHSMGSIIAFDALSDPSVNLSINTFVTMGSPLGLPPIVARNFQAQKTFDPHLTKPKAPDCIWPHWYNLSDGRDTVALDHTLRDDYAANQKGLKAIDLLVTNDYQNCGESNPHKSFGYLRASQVARILDTFLSDRRDDLIRKKCDLIVGNIAASTRRIWRKVAR